MATGVKPRDEDATLTRTELEYIQDALKTKKFRDMLVDYCEEIRDPANQALYQKEMTQLEKERGYDVTFINPKGGYVIKTSVAGDRKAFINICSNESVQKPSCEVQVVDGKKGMNWKIPYSLLPPREDYNMKRERCVIYDVVYHPDTLRMAERNKQFRELVNKTALDALQKNYNIHLDCNNCKFPKSAYKGMAMAAVIRKEDPNYQPPNDEEEESLPSELLEKLYPQKSYGQSEVIEKSEQVKTSNIQNVPQTHKEETTPKPQKESSVQSSEQPHRKRAKNTTEYSHNSLNGYTVPKYVIKQQKDVDLQDYTYHKESKKYTAIPSQIVVEINLPLLNSTKECTLDVEEKHLSLTTEKPAKYKLDITLPYPVNDQCGNAKFDKSKRKLIVTLPVMKKCPYPDEMRSSKADSGVESEDYSGSLSDEESGHKLIEELPIAPATENSMASPVTEETVPQETLFLDPKLGYILPSYTYNVLDDTIAFTFHVKNTEPDSVSCMKTENKIQVKFTSIGSGYMPIHYAAVIILNEDVQFNNLSAEAWDNNVILQIEGLSTIPNHFQIGLDESDMKTEEFLESFTQVSKEDHKETPEIPTPVVAVQNLGSETNIVVSSIDTEFEDETGSSAEEKEIQWVGIGQEIGAKSILRKSLGRSYSESSAGDIASSMDYVSSDCIPEESSLKKTVRFSDVINKQFYRHNSSIEGQKKKNQRKKSKKRIQERRKSESEAEDDSQYEKSAQPSLKSTMKQRRDSGLADTDGDHTPNSSPQEEKPQEHTMLNIFDKKNDKENSNPAIWESEDTPKKGREEKVDCDNIQHNTDLYDPEKLNKGLYLEVQFKNDLIFDLDM